MWVGGDRRGGLRKERKREEIRTKEQARRERNQKEQTRPRWVEYQQALLVYQNEDPAKEEETNHKSARLSPSRSLQRHIHSHHPHLLRSLPLSSSRCSYRRRPRKRRSRIVVGQSIVGVLFVLGSQDGDGFPVLASDGDDASEVDSSRCGCCS